MNHVTEKIRRLNYAIALQQSYLHISVYAVSDKDCEQTKNR